MQQAISNTNLEQHPIDAVILWVDGEDEKHKEKIQPYLKDTKITNSKKFRTRYDQVNEIEFIVNCISFT